MRILLLGYWGLNDSLTTPTVFPHLHILHLLKLPVLRVAIRSILLVLIVLAMLKGLRIGLVHFFG